MNITEGVISECIPVGCVRFQYIIQIHKNKLILQLIISSDMKTSMHSSRMRTARWLLYGGRGPSIPGVLCPGGYLPRESLSGGGDSVSGGLCPGGSLSRGSMSWGSLSGVSVQGVSVWGDLSGGVCLGGLPDRDPLSPVNRMTDRQV